MFNDFDPQDFHWVLPVYQYKKPEQLLTALATKVIAPAEAKVEAFEERKRKFEAELGKPRRRANVGGSRLNRKKARGRHR